MSPEPNPAGTTSVKAAYVMAFLAAAYVILAALISGPIVMLPFAAIPLIAGIGILRRRVWSAYGYAVCLMAQLLLIPVVLVRPGGAMSKLPEMVVAFAATAALAVLFVTAGRALRGQGQNAGSRGHGSQLPLCSQGHVFLSIRTISPARQWKLRS